MGIQDINRHKLICESALCIALNFDQISKNNSGGVLTTASKLGETLVNRPKNADILFEGTHKINLIIDPIWANKSLSFNNLVQNKFKAHW